MGVEPLECQAPTNRCDERCEKKPVQEDEVVVLQAGSVALEVVLVGQPVRQQHVGVVGDVVVLGIEGPKGRR